MIAAADELIKTIDYVSVQNGTWFLVAAVVICGSLVVYLLRRALKQAEDVSKKFDSLTEKHLSVLEKFATATADGAASVQELGKRVATVLDRSSNVIEANTEAMADNTAATKQQARSNDLTTSALMGLKDLTDKTAGEVRRQHEDTESTIKKNTEALEDQKPKRARLPSESTTAS